MLIIQPSMSTLVWTLMVALIYIYIYIYLGLLASTKVDANNSPINVHFPLDVDSCYIFKFLRTISDHRSGC
jgi:hypothetical protein